MINYSDYFVLKGICSLLCSVVVIMVKFIDMHRSLHNGELIFMVAPFQVFCLVGNSR